MRVNFFLSCIPWPAWMRWPSPTSAPSVRPEGDAQATRRRRFDNTLVREFPNITNVDMSSTIAQVQQVLGQVIRAVEFLFGFTLAAGLVVLFAAVSATRGEREREFAIMRAVGASSRAAARRCSGSSCWAWACWRGVLSSVPWPRPWAGHWRVTCLSLPGTLHRGVPVLRLAGRCAAGAGRRLVGTAQRTAAPRWWPRCGGPLKTDLSSGSFCGGGGFKRLSCRGSQCMFAPG
jgi:hypothetical protein